MALTKADMAERLFEEFGLNKREAKAFGVLASARGIHAAAVARLGQRLRERTAG